MEGGSADVRKHGCISDLYPAIKDLQASFIVGLYIKTKGILV